MTRRTVPIVLGCAAMLSSSAHAGGFTSENVELLAQVPLVDFPDNPTRANDCWGYVSPSGREYALIGLRPSLGVVEVTDPFAPVIVDQVPHAASNWSDVKVYRDHCYVVNETGGGMDVIDLSEVDDGIVTLVRRVTVMGLGDVHNLAVDEVSGYIYLCLPDINQGRLVAFDLADPSNPVIAGQMSAEDGGGGIHDAQVVTYTDGPLAGRQICYGAAEGRGLDIIDVTDKSNMFRVSRTTYTNISYCHQCWLSEDRRYLFVGDESDERDFGIETRTLVFDVEDITDPELAAEFGNGLGSVDHNIYVKGQFVYEANDAAGLRVFDASDPLNAFEVAFFDTYPAHDDPEFVGLWSQYPFFPSGTVIGSDRTEGLFVWRVILAGDVTGDGLIDFEDLLALLAAWGDCPKPPEECPADQDGSGVVDFEDLLIVLANWT